MDTLTETKPKRVSPEDGAALLTYARAVIDGWVEENDGVALVKLGPMQDLENLVTEVEFRS